MPESSWGPALLGLMAIVLLIQTAALVALALAGRRLATHARTLEDEVRSRLGPSLDRLSRIAANAEEISDRLIHGLPQLEDAVADAAENIRRANRIFEGLEGLLSLPLRPLARGLGLFRRFRALREERSRPAFPAPRMPPP
jgi:hypothetical protein